MPSLVEIRSVGSEEIVLGRTDGRTDRRSDGQTNGRTDGRHRQTASFPNSRIDTTPLRGLKIYFFKYSGGAMRLLPPPPVPAPLPLPLSFPVFPPCLLNSEYSANFISASS